MLDRTRSERALCLYYDISVPREQSLSSYIIEIFSIDALHIAQATSVSTDWTFTSGKTSMWSMML
jgi:hypothetical protein